MIDPGNLFAELLLFLVEILSLNQPTLTRNSHPASFHVERIQTFFSQKSGNANPVLESSCQRVGLSQALKLITAFFVPFAAMGAFDRQRCRMRSCTNRISIDFARDSEITIRAISPKMITGSSSSVCDPR